MASPEPLGTQLSSPRHSSDKHLSNSTPAFLWGCVRSHMCSTKPPRANALFDGGTLCACVDTAIAKMSKTQFSPSGLQGNHGDAPVNSHKIMCPKDKIREKGTQSQRTVSRHIANGAGQRTPRQHVMFKRTDVRDTVFQTEK